MEDLIGKIAKLQTQIKNLERLFFIGLVAIGGAVLLQRNDLIPYLLLVLIIAQAYKALLRRQLKQKKFLAKEIEERTRQIRSERDAVQEESDKLAAALRKLADTQDELVRQEKMATVGQLTKGVVDRILNPLNYINNFANLTSGLTNDLRKNLESESEHIDKETYADSIELLDMMSSNLNKITDHGYNTVRIVKAMEELLKDRRGNTALTDINNLCRIEVDKIKRSYAKEIEKHHIQIRFERLTLSIMMDVNAEQLGNVLLNILKNAIYAVSRKAGQEPYSPEILFSMKIDDKALQITIRDNGTGIDDAIKDKIFAPFFTTKPTSEAAGVGLYLCREVIQNHRGTIEVKSKKGEYSEFLITLPIYQAPHPTASHDNEEN